MYLVVRRVVDLTPELCNTQTAYQLTRGDLLMRARSRTYVAFLVLVVSLVFVASAYASYWFFQGNLSGTTSPLHDAESTGNNQYSRMSFDNTNHPGHRQNIVLDDVNGNWHLIGAVCIGGSGCDTGSLGPVQGSYYTKGGCQVPTGFGYSVFTNCRYGTGP
jgi:hypothetical protein